MNVTILRGDSLTMLATLESESVQLVCTSPPYFALRDYGVAGQIGLEPTPALFIEHLVAVFDEVKRVLRNDGTLWVNLGDSYAGSGKGPTTSASTLADGRVARSNGAHKVFKRTEQLRQGFIPGEGGNQNGARNRDGLGGVAGIPAKNLLLIPERFAIAMQDSGWIVRSRIAWCKKSALPESVRDRPTSAWEHIWLFSKSRTYYYDAEAVRQAFLGRHGGGSSAVGERNRGGRNDGFTKAPDNWTATHDGANMRNFWLLSPEMFKGEHYAAFPTEIPKRCILAGTSAKGQCPACGAPWGRVVEREPAPTLQTSRQQHLTAAQVGRNGGTQGGGTNSTTFGVPAHEMPVTRTSGWQPSCSCDAGPPVPQTVLDPFAGTFTTCLVADRLDRNSIGIDLSPDYCAIGRRRIEQDAGWLADVTTVAGPVHVQAPLLLLDRRDA